VFILCHFHNAGGRASPMNNGDLVLLVILRCGGTPNYRVVVVGCVWLAC